MSLFKNFVMGCYGVNCQIGFGLSCLGGTPFTAQGVVQDFSLKLQVDDIWACSQQGSINNYDLFVVEIHTLKRYYEQKTSIWFFLAGLLMGKALVANTTLYLPVSVTSSRF
ncbi:hypothetical protein F7734_51335 [Scytonema sp. UIC 10036]|uniref:hypothetical protein n=1 Tax=Scytonema sp. UIC 10036 TaxID=2304196 RepID=UPI0012DAAC94|nr:hypothetical protein [Scytonema sp. UIC 10036]MUH00225.1 hypothetical protein [Scytonema sp. UIC 10036]